MLHCMGIQPIRVERLHSRFRRINGLRGGDSPDLPWHPEIAKVAIAEMEAVLFESGLEGGQSASSVRSRNISIFPNRGRCAVSRGEGILGQIDAADSILRLTTGA